jgi:hypothetical protein
VHLDLPQVPGQELRLRIVCEGERPQALAWIVPQVRAMGPLEVCVTAEGASRVTTRFMVDSLTKEITEQRSMLIIMGPLATPRNTAEFQRGLAISRRGLLMQVICAGEGIDQTSWEVGARSASFICTPVTF